MIDINLETTEEFPETDNFKPMGISRCGHRYEVTKEHQLLALMLTVMVDPEVDNIVDHKVIEFAESQGLAHCGHPDCDLPFHLHLPTLVVKVDNTEYLSKEEIDEMCQKYQKLVKPLLDCNNLYGIAFTGQYGGDDVSFPNNSSVDIEMDIITLSVN